MWEKSYEYYLEGAFYTTNDFILFKTFFSRLNNTIFLAKLNGIHWVIELLESCGVKKPPPPILFGLRAVLLFSIMRKIGRHIRCYQIKPTDVLSFILILSEILDTLIYLRTWISAVPLTYLFRFKCHLFLSRETCIMQPKYFISRKYFTGKNAYHENRKLCKMIVEMSRNLL